jgi:hypothetical protein
MLGWTEDWIFAGLKPVAVGSHLSPGWFWTSVCTILNSGTMEVFLVLGFVIADLMLRFKAQSHAHFLLLALSRWYFFLCSAAWDWTRGDRAHTHCSSYPLSCIVSYCCATTGFCDLSPAFLSSCEGILLNEYIIQVHVLWRMDDC